MLSPLNKKIKFPLGGKKEWSPPQVQCNTGHDYDQDVVHYVMQDKVKFNFLLNMQTIGKCDGNKVLSTVTYELVHVYYIYLWVLYSLK